MKKKVQRKRHERAAPRDVKVVMVPAIIRTDVDMEFIAAHRPKFTIKDLVVFAMALGGRIHQRRGDALAAYAIEFESRPHEVIYTKPEPTQARRRG